MNIAVNTRLLVDKKLDGIGWFTYNTLKNITTQHPEHSFYFFFDRKYDEKFIFSKNVIPVVVPPPTRHYTLWKFWLQNAVPMFLKKHKIDIFISPDGGIPTKLKIPTLSVIHDINFAHNPEDLPKNLADFYNKNFPIFANKSSRIATVSEYSKNDIIKTYGINSGKIDVVYNGANENFIPVNETVKNNIKKQYTNGKDYFVFVGSIHPRKNVKRLILAFDLFKKQTNSDLKLLIVGAKFFKNSDLFNTLEQLPFKDDIIFTGRLETENLQRVVASSLAMVFVPYFEGFGIPILEALYCDVPVISSNVTSMPEVAGEAAIYVNPKDIEKIAQAMQKISTDKELRSDLIKKGQIQRRKFSWQKTSEKLWNSVEKIIG